MKGKPLIFCATYQVNGQDQVMPETLAAIDAIEGEFDFVLGRFNPYRHGHLNILHQYQQARKITLEGGYSHLLSIEHDMLPPPSTLDLMLQAGAQVVYGVYLLRHGSKVLNAWRKVNSSYVGMSLDLFPDELAQARAQVVAEVSGVGLGCTMISREVLQRFDFHPAETNINSSVPDVAFATDCLRAGIKQVAHFGIICGHIEPSGNILWPFEKGKNNMIKIKVNKSVNGPMGLVLKEGEETEIPASVAAELERAGYISIVKSSKSSKPTSKSDKPTSKKVAEPAEK